MDAYFNDTIVLKGVKRYIVTIYYLYLVVLCKSCIKLKCTC